MHAPISDGHREMTLNWQSPFEATSPDTKAPALAAMLQSGALATVLSDLTSAATGTKPTAAQNNQPPSTVQDALASLKGRTGITKLNSTQIFTGMAPIRFTFNIHFRAIADSYTEVELPVNQLNYWAVPKKLSKDSIVKRVTSADQTAGGYIKALLPSLAPTMIAFQYKTYTYAPLVIESIGDPITAPISQSGYHTEKIIPITLCTLTALDRDDFIAIASPGASS
ncbi:hypothetical protein QYH69_33985 [Paraburkholderia sp. SARCC-3016]|uniref:hypothetical protein n=1 Tax=Paraburkholderia sp. SARCC-3016 TaxID=3058611 RepID=UPI002809E240|nr:hypothetical protein [Paraburkholderia sp. SARCC-3016]MDQ7982236.1 hypothetical protein [Paraburkholderia sp. SARCC-3016]